VNELVRNAVREGWWLGPGLGAGGPANHPGTQAGRQAGSPARLYDMFSRAWGAIRLVTPCSTEAPQPMQNTQAAAGRGRGDAAGSSAGEGQIPGCSDRGRLVVTTTKMPLLTAA
jgi:hypothetical protein